MLSFSDHNALMTAEYKLERARQFSRNAVEKLYELSRQKPYELICDGRYSDHYWSLVCYDNLPIDIMMNVGDAIHNWRSALDHCAYAFWQMDNTNNKSPKLTEDKIYFPIKKSETEYRKAVKDLQLSSDAEYIFLSFGAFVNGKNDALYNLSKLDNIDKHRLIPSANYTLTISGILKTSLEGVTYPISTYQIPPVTLRLDSRNQRTPLLDRGGRQIFAIHNLEPISRGQFARYDDSLSSASIYVELAEHRPTPYYDEGSHLAGSLFTFGHAVDLIIRQLNGLLADRQARR